MPIYLRQNVISELVAKLGGHDAIVADWEGHAAQNNGYARARQRSTIYRWLQEGVPSKGEEVLALCGLLDVDPFAVLDYERCGYFSNFTSIRRTIQNALHMVGLHTPWFQPMYRLMQPGPFWPSDGLAKRYWMRSWHAVEFTNQNGWASSDYGLVRMTFQQPAFNIPRAAHIAYRRLGSRDKMWRFYGTVTALRDRLELYSESGDYQDMVRVHESEIRFRTYFGGRKVEFRVASLHAFDHDLEFPFNDPSTIGFEW